MLPNRFFVRAVERLELGGDVAPGSWLADHIRDSKGGQFEAA